MSAIAFVDCPECRRAMAEVSGSLSQGLTVKYREAGIEDREDNPRGVVEVRPRQTSGVPEEEGMLKFWPCTCPEVRCPGRLVLDVQRVRQLARRAEADGHPIRWHPDAAAVERSERLRPYCEGSFWNGSSSTGQRRGVLMRLALSDPPPLVEVRKAGVRVSASGT